jgi:hypothetical protein
MTGEEAPGLPGDVADREAALGVGHLALRGGGEINAENVRQQHQVEQHVSHLLARPGPERVTRRERPGVGGREPLEQLGELADLADQGQEHRLGVVELPPVPVFGEFPHAVTENLEIWHASRIPRRRIAGVRVARAPG